MRAGVVLAACLTLILGPVGTALPANAAPGASDIAKAGTDTRPVVNTTTRASQ